MDASGPATLLRIFVGDGDRWHHKSLASAIVEEALKHGLAGATVLRGVEGFGANRHLHTMHLVELVSDLPIVIEIVDDDAKIQAFLPVVEQMMTNGLVTLERVTVHVYRGGREQAE
jgi:PII-like signaling protein